MVTWDLPIPCCPAPAKYMFDKFKFFKPISYSVWCIFHIVILSCTLRCCFRRHRFSSWWVIRQWIFAAINWFTACRILSWLDRTDVTHIQRDIHVVRCRLISIYQSKCVRNYCDQYCARVIAFITQTQTHRDTPGRKARHSPQISGRSWLCRKLLWR